MAKLLFKDVQAELTGNLIGIKRVQGEYKVWPKAENCGGLGTYFTDDLHDALMTGLSMARDAGTLVTRVERPTPVADSTVIQTLGQLNALLKPESQGWTVRRSLLAGLLFPNLGHYYMVHDTHAPSAGIYVYSCKGTTLGFWRRKLRNVISASKA